ncbi:MAG: hypothetical protein J7498_15365 [Sphingobium sp.]|nr:hypothetical protein [Sphingobium sp.]
MRKMIAAPPIAAMMPLTACATVKGVGRGGTSASDAVNDESHDRKQGATEERART